MTTTEPKNVRDWKKELNTVFFGGIPIDQMGSNQVGEEKLQEFITSLLKNIEQEVEGKKKPFYDWTKSEHGKKCIDGCTYCCNAEGNRNGYNSALEDFLTIIRSYMK